jgi:hypothetical protein
MIIIIAQSKYWGKQNKNKNKNKNNKKINDDNKIKNEKITRGRQSSRQQTITWKEKRRVGKWERGVELKRNLVVNVNNPAK